MRPLCVSKQTLRAGQRTLLVSVLNGQRRAYNVAVLGGGITGLSAAWMITHHPFCTSVTLYEKSPRLGGWMDSETVPVPGGKVVFEYGPRTLRGASPTSKPLLNMIARLGLSAEDFIITPKDHPAAVNRYIYYPDHLVRLPTPMPGAGLKNNIFNIVQTVADEPLFKSFLSGIFSDLTTPPRGPAEWTQDESMARFISRRFNPTIADNLLSAVMHGIYAGDIDRLSAQTLLGGQRNLEAHGGVLAGLFKLAIGQREIVQIDDYLASISVDDYILGTPSPRGSDLAERLGKASTFAFKNGNSRLVDALEASLKKSPNVKVAKSAEITSFRRKPNTSEINITSQAEGHRTFDRVIATIPAPELAQLLASSNHAQGYAPTETIKRLRKQNYATTVRVVNLYYENPSLLPPGINGFGYLIPRSIPFDQNPECGLGVIFSAGVANDGSPLGTQLTVMFGGHYWDDWKDSDYPDHDSAIKMARTMLERHLGIKEKPVVTGSKLQKNAIPQYTVGHLDHMYLLSKTVRDEWDKRLTLAGNWYNGVGVPACVKQGVLAAQYGTRAGSFFHHNTYPLRRYDTHNWELEGGLVMPPVRLDEWDKGERYT